jgi:hypothetical protein
METFLTTKLSQIPWFNGLKGNLAVFKKSISM